MSEDTSVLGAEAEAKRADIVWCETLRTLLKRQAAAGGPRKKKGVAKQPGAARLSELIRELGTVDKVPRPSDAADFEWAPVEAAIKNIHTEMATLEGRTRRNNQDVNKPEKDESRRLIAAYETAVAKMYENIQKRIAGNAAALQQGFSKGILDALGQVALEKAKSQDPKGDEWLAVEETRVKLDEARATKKGSNTLEQKDVTAAESEINKAIETAKTAIGLRLEAAKIQLSGEVKTGGLDAPPPGAFADHVDQLAKLKISFEAKLGTEPFTADAFSESAKVKEEMAVLHGAMGLRKKDLGDLKGGLGEQGALLDTMEPKAQAIVADTVKAFPSLEAATKFCADLGGPKSLEALLTKGCGGDLEMLKTVASKIEPAKLKQVLDGGFAEKPECLAELLKTGSTGKDAEAKGDSFKEWIDTLGTHGAKTKVLLGAKGGLGDQPEVFGQLLAVGCDGKPANGDKLFKDLAEGDLNNLNTLVKDGGFGKVEAKDGKEVKADCLGELLKTGCGADPGKLKTVIGKLSAPTDLAKLKGLLESGGLGANPKALGELLKGADALEEQRAVAAKNGVDLTTSEANEARGRAAGQLTALATTFAAPADLQRLSAVLGAGGLGAKPQALGGLLQTGCQGEPARLKVITDGYPAPDAGKLAVKDAQALKDQKNLELLNGVLNSGGLGSNPEVFGNLVATGCDGAPDKLKKFTAAFDTPEKLGKLGNLIGAGGLGGQATDKKDTLAKVFKKGLGEKPENLLHLNDAFADSTELKGVFDAFNTAPPAEPDPGVRLGSVMGALDKPKPPGKTDQVKLGLLESRFYRGLDTQARDASTVNIPRRNGGYDVKNKSELSLPKLLRISATFEFKPFVAPKVPAMAPPPGKVAAQTTTTVASAKVETTVAAKQAAANAEPNARVALTKAGATAAAARDAAAKYDEASAKALLADQSAALFEQAAKQYLNAWKVNQGADATAANNAANALQFARRAADAARRDMDLAVETAAQAAEDARTAAEKSAKAVPIQKRDAAKKAENANQAAELLVKLTETAGQKRSEASAAAPPADEAERVAAEEEAKAKLAATKAADAANIKVAPEDAEGAAKAAKALETAKEEAAGAAQTAKLAKEQAAALRNIEKDLKAKLATAELAVKNADIALKKKQKEAADSAQKAVAVEAAAAAAGEAATDAEAAAKAADEAILAFDCRDLQTANIGHFCKRHTRGNFTFAEDELSNRANVESDLASGDDYREKRGARKAKITTFYPENTTPADVTSYFEEAMSELSKLGKIPTKTSMLDIGGNEMAGQKKSPERFWTETVDLPKARYQVQVGFKFDSASGKITVSQFVPVGTLGGGGPLETVPFWDMHAVKTSLLG